MEVVLQNWGTNDGTRGESSSRKVFREKKVVPENHLPAKMLKDKSYKSRSRPSV